MTSFAFIEDGEIGICNLVPFGISECYEVPDGTDPSLIYIKDGQVKWYPPKPSEYHTFDTETEEWIDASANHFGKIQSAGLAKVNETTSAIRDRFVTPISSQATVYELKRQQAIAFLADADPQPEDYPLIFAEVGITADTPENVAQVYLGLNAIFLQALAAVEQIRLTAVAAIEAATTKADVDGAISAFNSAIQQLPF